VRIVSYHAVVMLDDLIISLTARLLVISQTDKQIKSKHNLMETIIKCKPQK